MKVIFFLAVCLIYLSSSEARGTIQVDPIPPGYNSISTDVLNSPQCAPLVQQLSQLQLLYLQQHHALLRERSKNQDQQSLVTHISKVSQQGRSGSNPVAQDEIQSEITIEGTETPVQGFIPGLISKTSNVAGHIVNTAGQLAKDDIDLKAALIGGALGGAGTAASNALHKTGEVAARAASNIEGGFKNIFGSFGK